MLFVHRPECYCLRRHVLTEPSFSMRGIIIVYIKLIERRHTLFTKGFVNEVVCKNILFLLFFFFLASHSEWSECGSQMFSTKHSTF